MCANWATYKPDKHHGRTVAGNEQSVIEQVKIARGLQNPRILRFLLLALTETQGNVGRA